MSLRQIFDKREKTVKEQTHFVVTFKYPPAHRFFVIHTRRTSSVFFLLDANAVVVVFHVCTQSDAPVLMRSA